MMDKVIFGRYVPVESITSPNGSKVQVAHYFYLCLRCFYCK